MVNLNGDPKPTKVYVPEMNAKILADQGVKIDEKTKSRTPIINQNNNSKNSFNSESLRASKSNGCLSF